LKTYGELPDTAKINETDTFGDEGDDDGVEFGGESDVSFALHDSSCSFLVSSLSSSLIFLSLGSFS